MVRWIYWLCYIAICSALPLMGSEAEVSAEPIQVEIIHEEESIQPGRPFWIAIRLQHQDEWHTYSKDPGDVGMATTIDWNLPEGFTASSIVWPTPQRFSVDSITGYGYEGEVLLLTEITPPSQIDLSQEKEINASVRWLACSSSMCVPGESQISSKLVFSSDSPKKHPKWAAAFATAKETLTEEPPSDLISMNDLAQTSPLAPVPPAAEALDSLSTALIMAFVGGLILNLMPCVLPVVSFKILSFVKMAGKSRTLTMKHGLAFSIGVIVSFWILAGFLFVFQAYGHLVGWGFQLQEPLFVAFLAAILFIFSLNLFGVFEGGSFVASLAGRAQRPSDKLTGSFFSGILATAIATPCTGPFLGSAIGFAITVSAPEALLIFTTLGIGMASPYLLLAAYPKLLRFLPKPGNWMITFKEITGFIVLATVLWLTWVFGAQTDPMALVMLLMGLFAIAVGCWIFGKWGSPIKPRLVRFLSYVLITACFGVGGYIIATSTSNLAGTQKAGLVAQADEWETFSPERVAELQSQGIPVLIDFTAKWCLICQANHFVLTSDSVTQKLDDLGVVKMKADWTRNDPVITEELRKHGRNGVPLYLLYGTDATQPPKIMPQVLTSDIVLEHLSDVES